MAKAIVCFTDSDDHPLGFMLKRGFRHCFCVVLSNGLWIEVNGARGVPFARYITPDDDTDLAEIYRSQGCTVQEVDIDQTAPPWPLLLRNCVGLVKAFANIRCFAVTPWQLYRYLEKRR